MFVFDLASLTFVDCVSYPTLTFGAPITAEDQAVLLQLVGHMEEYAMEEGLFRKPGSKARVEQLAQDLTRTPFHLVACDPSYTPHDYASVLKHYFSELPEPLMLQRNSEAYHQAAGKTTRCLIVSAHSVRAVTYVFTTTVAHRANLTKCIAFFEQSSVPMM